MYYIPDLKPSVQENCKGFFSVTRLSDGQIFNRMLIHQIIIFSFQTKWKEIFISYIFYKFISKYYEIFNLKVGFILIYLFWHLLQIT